MEASRHEHSVQCVHSKIKAQSCGWESLTGHGSQELKTSCITLRQILRKDFGMMPYAQMD